VRRREAGAVERLEAQLPADAVQRRVDDPQRARGDRGELGEDRLQVGLGHLLADALAAGAQRHVGERADGVDRRGDVRVGGRRDLGAVAEVDLVAVVVRGVVAGGDHHAGGAAEVADREREQRRGRLRREAECAQPRAGEDRGRLLGEARRPVAGVVADDDPGGHGAGDGVEQVAREAGARPAHGGDVHARRPGAEPAAQAGGAEREAVREARRQLGGRARVEQRPQLGARLRVGVVGDPALDARVQFVHQANAYETPVSCSEVSQRRRAASVARAAALMPTSCGWPRISPRPSGPT
jgi:hypothetical protein